MALPGDVRPSPMANPAERPLPKLPLPLRPETWTTPQLNYFSGQNVTEHARSLFTPPGAEGGVAEPPAPPEAQAQGVQQLNSNHDIYFCAQK